MISKSFRSYTTYINNNGNIQENKYINLIDNDDENNNNNLYLINNNSNNQEYNQIYKGKYNNYELMAKSSNHSDWNVTEINNNLKKNYVINYNNLKKKSFGLNNDDNIYIDNQYNKKIIDNKNTLINYKYDEFDNFKDDVFGLTNYFKL